MMLQKSFIVLLLGNAVASNPVMPKEYSAVLTVKMPYIGLDMPIKIVTTSSSQRVDYFDGLEVDHSSAQGSYKYDFKNAVRNCAHTPASSANGWKPMQMLPDLTEYTRAGDELIGGVLCHRYVLNTPHGTAGTMNDHISFYWDPVLEKPVRWRQHSRPVAFSSHTDDYIFDYISFDKKVPRAEDVAVPSLCHDKPVETPNLFIGLQGILLSFHGQSDFAVANGDVGSLFAAFIAGHSKAYAAEEHAMRKRIFVKNVKKIRELNEQNSGKATFKGNRFLDLTTEEVMQFRGGASPTSREDRTSDLYSGLISVHEKLGPIPKEFDWRTAKPGAVGRVKDQGFCGSCWTFGALGPVETMVALQTGRHVELPEQFVVDCTWSEPNGSQPATNNGCSGGEAEIGILEIIRKYGGKIPTAKSYGGYQSINGYCKDVKQMEVGAKVSSWVNIKERDEAGLLHALATKGPVSVNIMVPEDLHYYDTGVVNTPKCKHNKSAIGHAVVAVGYGTDEHGVDYYTIRNSWSTWWGEKGYVRIARGENDCAIASDAGYPVVAPMDALKTETFIV